MKHEDNSIGAIAPRILTRWGFWAVLTRALAIVLVFGQMVGPIFEPNPSVGQQIGEIAGEIKRSAWKTFLGIPKAEPDNVAPNTWAYIGFAGPTLGAIAIILAVISGVLRENWRYPVYGTGLGVAAITFHFIWWIALMIAGTMILVAIIENMGDIFSA